MLRVEKNKRGWLMIVEAVIAIMILFGFLFIAMAKQSQEIKNVRGEHTFYNVVSMLAEKVQTNESLRNEVYEQNGQSEIKDYLENEIKMINARLMAGVNIVELVEPCTVPDETRDKEVYSASIVISTNSTTYNPKKLCIFVWEE